MHRFLPICSLRLKKLCMESSPGTLNNNLLAKDILFCISFLLGVNIFSAFLELSWSVKVQWYVSLLPNLLQLCLLILIVVVFYLVKTCAKALVICCYNWPMQLHTHTPTQISPQKQYLKSVVLLFCHVTHARVTSNCSFVPVVCILFSRKYHAFFSAS